MTWDGIIVRLEQSFFFHLKNRVQGLLQKKTECKAAKATTKPLHRGERRLRAVVEISKIASGFSAPSGLFGSSGTISESSLAFAFIC
jgi:hypothetical protein